MAFKRGLGRGLKALIEEGPQAERQETQQAAPPQVQSRNAVVSLPVEKLRKSDFQPRQSFGGEAMEDLVRSIAERGVLQPLLVRRKGDGYELIAGERRLRAAGQAGLTEVPALVMEASDRESLEVALIENLQREDLNPLEEAQGYKALVDKFELTQEQIAKRVGKARTSVANALRLLDLPPEVGQKLASGDITTGHAKVLLGVEIREEQVLLAKQVVLEGLSVRELERLVNKFKHSPRKSRASHDDIPATHVAYVTDLMRKRLGTAVKIRSCRTFANGKKARGRIEVEYYSSDDLDRIMEILGLGEGGAV